MEPRIQYAKTRDGVSIAFCTMGEGKPLVFVPFIPSHIQLWWGIPEVRRFFGRIAEGRRLALYDNRGSGLSDRDVADHSLNAHLLDLEAVVGQLQLDRFSLMAVGLTGMVATAYAAGQPEKVERLVLGSAVAAMSDVAAAPMQAIGALLETDWELYNETVVQYYFAWSDPEQAQKWVSYFREAITPDAARAIAGGQASWDVADLLSQVRSPTIVLHPRQIPFIPVESAKRVASGIPNGRLVLVEGRALGLEQVNFETVTRAINEFLAEGEEAPAAARLPEGMAVLLFADIAESTALTEQLGDAAFRAKARELDTSLRSVIRDCGGTPVEGKVLGDGVLAVFTSARQAIDCALRCRAAGHPLGLQLHLGLHAGDVIREGNNVYGGAVNIAARVASASAPGEVLVSDIVRGLARTSAGVRFEDRGERELKGVSEPVRLYRVSGTTGGDISCS